MLYSSTNVIIIAEKPQRVQSRLFYLAKTIRERMEHFEKTFKAVKSFEKLETGYWFPLYTN